MQNQKSPAYMLNPINVLALFAHPDNAEFICAGTLAHWAGSHNPQGNADDGRLRKHNSSIGQNCRSEAERGIKVRRPDWRPVPLPEKQGSPVFFYDRPHLSKVMELVRQNRPFLVLTHSPADYMIDHKTVSHLCQSA